MKNTHGIWESFGLDTSPILSMGSSWLLVLWYQEYMTTFLQLNDFFPLPSQLCSPQLQLDTNILYSASHMQRLLVSEQLDKFPSRIFHQSDLYEGLQFLIEKFFHGVTPLPSLGLCLLSLYWVSGPFLMVFVPPLSVGF